MMFMTGCSGQAEEYILEELNDEVGGLKKTGHILLYGG